MKIFIYLLFPFIVLSNYNSIVRNKFLRLYIVSDKYKHSLKKLLCYSKLSIDKIYENIQITYGKLYFDYDSLTENDKYIIETMIALFV